MKQLINKIIDFFYEKKRVKKKYKPLTNKALSDGLANGKLFVACIKSRNNNFVSRMITKFSGPYSHVVTIANRPNVIDCALMAEEDDRLFDKYGEYYDGYPSYFSLIVLASADENGMNYFSISEYQNRGMTIFDMTPVCNLLSSSPTTEDDIIHEFLSENVMNANYDYTGLVGQIFRKLGKRFYSLFDDERAYYCSEQAEIFKHHGVKIADNDEPTPTEIYNYCIKHYPVVYEK